MFDVSAKRRIPIAASAFVAAIAMTFGIANAATKSDGNSLSTSIKTDLAQIKSDYGKRDADAMNAAIDKLQGDMDAAIEAKSGPSKTTSTTAKPATTTTVKTTAALGPSNDGATTNSMAGNIATLPDFYDSTWLSWNDGYNSFPNTWQGYTNVLKVAANPEFIKGQRASGWTGENEINGMVCSNGKATGCDRSGRGNKVAVKPGQTVTYSAYVWVGPSTVGAPSGGGFQFFIDVYSNSGRIKELQGTNGCDGCGRVNVPYGSTGWTKVEMKFTVANSYTADGAIGGGAGASTAPTGIIPILQINNWAVPSGWDDKAVAYVRNTVLTVQ